jgi:catechol 2,3-dioxygenase-like lactoylglutathione lyase family enzyme
VSPGELRFHHLGLAVKRPEAARTFLEGLGYALEAPVWDPRQRVNVQMARHGAMPAVELVYPGDGASPIDALLQRVDSGVYHTCYETPDLDAAQAALEARGLRVFPVGEPEPAVLFGGRRVAFLRVHGVGVVELLEVSG